MPRKRLEKSDFYPYHVCARANNQEWFSAPLNEVYEVYSDVSARTIEKYSLQIHAFVLMSNHFHMLCSTPQSNLDIAMRYFMTESSRSIARLSHRINKIYGSRYYWTIIRESSHYAYAFKYIYRNPVRAGIVSRVQSYPWSTLNFFKRKMNSLIQSNESGFGELIPPNRRQLLLWLNECEDSEHEASMRKALRRREFKFPRDRHGFAFKPNDALIRKKMTGT